MRAFSMVVMPALAMLMVCCSIACHTHDLAQDMLHHKPCKSRHASCYIAQACSRLPWQGCNRLLPIGA